MKEDKIDLLERKNRSLEIALEESEKLLNETKSALQNISDRTKSEFDKKADVESLTVHYEEKLRKSKESYTTTITSLRDELDQKSTDLQKLTNTNENLIEQLDFQTNELQIHKNNSTSNLGDLTSQLAIINDKYKKLKIESETKIQELTSDLETNKMENEEYSSSVLTLRQNLENKKQDYDILANRAQQLELQLKENCQNNPNIPPSQFQLNQLQTAMQQASTRLSNEVKKTTELEDKIKKYDKNSSKMKNQITQLANELGKSKDALEKKSKESLKMKERILKFEKDNNKLKLERMGIIDQLAQTREECLLAALSEKDTQLALMEFQSAGTSQIREIKAQRETLLLQVKQHSENRAKVNERQKKYIEKDLNLQEQYNNLQSNGQASSANTNTNANANNNNNINVLLNASSSSESASKNPNPNQINNNHNPNSKNINVNVSVPGTALPGLSTGNKLGNYLGSNVPVSTISGVGQQVGASSSESEKVKNSSGSSSTTPSNNAGTAGNAGV